jgi:hypothetical protein
MDSAQEPGTVKNVTDTKFSDMDVLPDHRLVSGFVFSGPML